MPKIILEYPAILERLLKQHYALEGIKGVARRYRKETDSDITDNIVYSNARKFGLKMDKRARASQARQAKKQFARKRDLAEIERDKTLFRCVERANDLPQFDELERLALCASRCHGDHRWEGR